MQCTKCGSPLRRVSRHGFLQEKFYPIFGYFPWECPRCRVPVMKKGRGASKRRSKSENSGSQS